MEVDYEQRLVRACLAAVARRGDIGLVVSFADIEAEYARGPALDIAIDGDAKAVRITAPEART